MAAEVEEEGMEDEEAILQRALKMSEEEQKVPAAATTATGVPAQNAQQQ